MKIKTNYVPDNAKTYLTVGKEYTFIPNDDDCGWIADDEDEKILVFVDGCEHLDNRAWEVCDAAD